MGPSPWAPVLYLRTGLGGGLWGAARGAVPRENPASGAVGTSAAALPCSSRPAGGLFIQGPGPSPGPGPGPCWSIGQSVPLRAAPGAAALCPRRTPQQRRSYGGRAPDPSSGLHLLFLLLLAVRLNPVFPPPPLFFSGHPGQPEPVMPAGGWGKEEEAKEMETEKRAVGALLQLSRLRL